jgi:segregation and condensation protein A
MSYLVNLDKFYGPLDLLIYLLEKEEMDIYDIPVSLITDQYMDYIQANGQIDLENIGDFLIMASYLLNLKSRMLLPGIMEEENSDEDIADPREELVNKILEYKKYKMAGEFLASRFNDETNRIFFRNGASDIELVEREFSSSINALLRAWYSVLEKTFEEPQYNLPQRDVNISEKMDLILRVLPDAGTAVIFQDFFNGVPSKREALAYFLALLELIRLQKVEAIQEQRFGDIKLCLRVAINDVDAG